MVIACFITIHIDISMFITENQVMSEGEDDLPVDVQPLPDPPSR